MFISAYGPGSERSEEEREEFWSELSECVGSFGRNESVVVLGDLNARVGSEVIEGIVGQYGVPGRNESGERLLEMSAEQELVESNSGFKKKDVYKYTWLRMAEGRVVDRALMDYVLSPNSMLGRLLDVDVWRGGGGRMSDHFLVEARLKLVGRWRSAGRMEGVRNVFKSSELNNSVKGRAYQESLRENMHCWEVKSAEKESEKFRDIVMECTNDVFGMRRVGEQRRKGSEWWNELVGRWPK